MNQNDTNLLCADNYVLPTYAQTNIWLCAGTETAQVSGANGTFSHILDQSMITMHWAASDGPLLGSFQPGTDSSNLKWDGRVALGGYLDAVHMMVLDDTAISLYFLAAHPLKQHYKAFPAATQRGQIPYQGADFHMGLVTETPETITTWLVASESPLNAIMENALVNNLRVYCFGELAEEESGWEDFVALPLTLDAVTLFSP